MHRVVAALFLYFFAVPGTYCQQKPCTKAEHLQAEKEAAGLRSWDALYKSHRKYGHCGDDEAREGYSESIARILVDHWETLPRLAKLIEIDKSFGRFVGLDATMNMPDLARIRANSIDHCPAGLAKLCAKLRKEADDAIAEDVSVNK
jgi:hypothetical protein